MSALPPESGHSKIAQFREKTLIATSPASTACEFQPHLLLNKPIARHPRLCMLAVLRSSLISRCTHRAHAAL
jgi:hypothetical protein